MKALTLTNKRLCSLAQPVLFERVRLCGRVREALFVARKLEKMFNSRAGSDTWVHHLFMFWDPLSLNGPPSPAEVQGMQQLEEIAASFLTRFRNIQSLHIEQVKLSFRAYSQLFLLPRLKKVCVRGVSIIRQPGDVQPNSDSLNISDLSVLRRLGPSSAVRLMDPSIAKLAQSPKLKSLRLWSLVPQSVRDILGSNPLTLTNLTELEVSNPQSPFDSLMSLAPYCPNLLKLSLGSNITRIAPGNPNAVSSLPPTVSPEVWPLLQDVRGWLKVAQLLVPGRPIMKLRITEEMDSNEQWDRTSLIPLARGSAVVKELALKQMLWRDEAVDEIAGLFPELELLEISTYGPNQVTLFYLSPVFPHSLWSLQRWLVDNLLRVVELFPQLRTLVINVGPRRPSFRALRGSPEGFEDANLLPLLREAKSLRPSLVDVVFGFGVRWMTPDDKTWRRAESWLLRDDMHY